MGPNRAGGWVGKIADSILFFLYINVTSTAIITYSSYFFKGMEKSIHFTGGLQDLIFGRWMPVHLYHQYESGEHPLTERMWDLPDSPAEYIKLDKSLLNRWRDAVDSSEYFKTWTPPFYRLSPGLEAPFHPVCRFYDHVIWCECRMIIQAALKMQEILPMTQLKYELVTLQQELSGLLQECHRRVENTGPESTGIGDKLSHYLHKLAKNSILILLLDDSIAGSE